MQTLFQHWKPVFHSSGRQYWERTPVPQSHADADFSFDLKKNPNSADKVFRSWKQMQAVVKKNTANTHELYQQNKSDLHPLAQQLEKGFDYYLGLLTEHGFISGDYGGPHFLLPGLIIVSHVTNSRLSEEHEALMRMYMFNHQQEDGGWGLHIEGESTMLGTGLQYVALRILGTAADDSRMVRAREWIHRHGGVTHIPSWGKFYLSVLGVYRWEGCHSLFPEIWLLPHALPIHPGRYWCHARMVYLPMAYCYGHRITGEESTLVHELRRELYPEGWEKVNWKAARDGCCATDRFHQSSRVLRLMQRLLQVYEKIALPSLRKKALNFILKYIQAEDAQTNYINIGPVNQVINSLCVWHAHGERSEAFQKHKDRWKDYLWIAEDGMKMQGYNGAQLWETAFTVNALAESGLATQYTDSMQRMYGFIDRSQILKTFAKGETFYRHQPRGGWPFSTVDHGWPITDCTGDGVKATLVIHQFFRSISHPIQETIDLPRLRLAVDLMLSFQSEDGGWASYEVRRGPFWLEHLNPSEVFGEIMVDYPYVECTSSTIQALRAFQKADPDYRREEIEHKIGKGISFLYNRQRADGSWYGSWGVCFTYAAWFALEALAVEGFTYSNHEQARRGCDFLVRKQREDGSWGESYKSCVEQRWVEHEQGQIIQTAWALLGMMAVGYPDTGVLQRGISFIAARQEENGDFPQEGISGVFNKNCMETYTSYRNVFPLWAISRFLRLKLSSTN